MSESNQFLATIQRHRNGGMLAEASDKLAKVVAAVAHTGKPGKLTITLEVKPTKRGGATFIGLRDAIVEKSPQMQPEESWWFATEAGVLQKNDPNQEEFRFQPKPVQGGVAVEVQDQVNSHAANA